MIYEELVAALCAWVNRAEIEPSIPTFVALAEAQINRRLAQAGVVSSVARAAAVIDGEYSALPDDFAAPVSIRLADGTLLESVSQVSFDALRAQNAAPGTPQYFTVSGTELAFLPAPIAATTVELVYHARLPAVSASMAANWVLIAHPDVYLYGALLQAAPFLGEDGRAQTWGQLYEAGMASLIEAESARRGPQNTPAFRARLPQRACA